MDREVGKVIKFFSKISVAVILTKDEIKVGDNILIRGSGNLSQTITSMQINHKNVDKVNPDEEFGMKTNLPVEEGDIVYIVDEDVE